jgi:hypothetical protein
VYVKKVGLSTIKNFLDKKKKGDPVSRITFCEGGRAYSLSPERLSLVQEKV